MGITWKAMPLLSTLAALVIIVHSAEEDFEPDYRDLRPRRSETATSSYEQPWGIMDTEPAAIQSTQTDWEVRSQQEQPKRRRPVRKRKRRPLTTVEDDLVPQERQVYSEEYRPYQLEKFSPPPNTIRRRRKQFDSRPLELTNTWIDTVDAERPLIRKRGQKRKRPSVEETWPQLREFNEYSPNVKKQESDEQEYMQPTDTIQYGLSRNYDKQEEVYVKQDIETDSEQINPNESSTHKISYSDEHIKYPRVDEDDNREEPTDVTENKSLSEFSLESPSSSEDIISAQKKIAEEAVKNDAEKDKGPSDPQILKEILKKSNGRSLSEILQQHNLSLGDLLHGKEKAISILKIEDLPRNDSNVQLNVDSTLSNENREVRKENKRYHNRNIDPKPNESVRETITVKNIAKELTDFSTEKIEPITEHMTTKPQNIQSVNSKDLKDSPNSDSNFKINTQVIELTTKSSLRRRFPVGIRKKIRMRPSNNTAYKSQLSRDLIALTSRRYHFSRNSSRTKEWKDLMPTMVKTNVKEEPDGNIEKLSVDEFITTTIIPEETTRQRSFEDSKLSTISDVTEYDPTTTNIQVTSDEEQTTISLEVIENIPTTTTTPTPTLTTTTTSTTTPTTTTSTTSTTTEKAHEKPVLRPIIKASDIRRQIFNNRLKRKRLKQKTTTAQPTEDYAMKDIFSMANLVSASEFVAKIQPRTTNSEEEQDFTTLEDFMTTETSIKRQTKTKSTKTPNTKYATTHTVFPIHDTEETAKIEIEEILNDTRTSARLSKILMERNMTINELVEHRERGSSHIHLADIFHNASREPNPPEPFLSKSSIEPISKETYPLRALLEANLHDPTAKATTIDPDSTQPHYLNIPVVMDFGNNVNENGENMGIMSLFNNFTKRPKMDADTHESKEESINTSSLSPLDSVNDYKNGNNRESRILNTDKDLVTWKEIIAIMHRGQNNYTNEPVELTTRDIPPTKTVKKIILDDDLESEESLIVLNDLKHHKDMGNHDILTSEENIEIQMPHRPELPQVHGVLNKTSNSAKSVTVATASIIGLAMVLFLLTYVVFRWKQQRNFFREKQSMRTDRIPTPVFENRKGHKNNSSTRSKSPMISSSNIYSIETIDTRNGSDSPEYMWDSLRKPFQ